VSCYSYETTVLLLCSEAEVEVEFNISPTEMFTLQPKNEGMCLIHILTLCNHVILYFLGLARMLHSKYTSSFSLMVSGLSLLPNWSVTCGGSVNV
jgi:hypothetical protein